MAAKRKQPSEFKVSVTFTPVVDWDIRLKRVMALLLRSQSNVSSSKVTCAGSDSTGKEVPNAD